MFGFPFDPIMRAISSSENPTARPSAINASRSNMLSLKTRRNLSGVNYLVRFATTMMAGWVVLLFTLSSLLKLLLSPVAFPL